MSHIKLHGVKPRIQYVANGTLSTYEFPFVIFANTDIKVYLNDVLQDTTTYSVTGIKNTKGGSITFMAPPTNGTIITITRDLSIERTTDFQEGGALRADTLNDEFDYQTACLQQVADSINRSMILPPYASDANVDLTLPTPSAGKAIVWNSEGTNLENSTVEVNALESTLKTYKETAETASANATTQAEIATDKATEATEQAGIATQKAEETANALATKINVDMDNLSSIGKVQIVSLGMPDFESAIAQNDNTVYQAETDGFLRISGTSTNGNISSIYLQYSLSDDMSNPINVATLYVGTTINVTTTHFLIIPKGMYYKAYTPSSGFSLTFYPVKGV